MLKNLSRLIVFISSILLLSACAGLGDDNTPAPTPLTNFPLRLQPVELWSLGTGGSLGKDFLRLGPIINNQQVYATNKNGFVTAVDLKTGHKTWQVKFKQRLSSAPAVGYGRIIFASFAPQLIALDAQSGDLIWKVALPNQVIASPVINCNLVIVKTIDGKVLAYNIANGALLWTYDHGAPMLILRPSGAANIVNGKVLIGFSDGTLSALSINTGRLLWERTIAYPTGITQTDQLVDISADPLTIANTLYVVTYNGKLMAMSANNGQIKWQRAFSSYAGMAIGKYLFVSETDGSLWAFNKNSGQVIWHNRLLLNRGITAPALLANNLVVGDKLGYLHWFSQTNGQPLAYVLVHEGASIAAAPKVSYPYVCVLTRQGGLSAWLQAEVPL